MGEGRGEIAYKQEGVRVAVGSTQLAALVAQGAESLKLVRCHFWALEQYANDIAKILCCMIQGDCM